MKFKKAMALGMAAVMTMSLAACGSSETAETKTEAKTDAAETKTDATTDATTETQTDAAENADAASGELTYASIKLG